MSVLTTAQYWVDQGQSVIPIGFRSKRPDFRALRWTSSLTESGRVSWEAYKQRLPTEHELRVWFDSGPRCNLGIVTGYRGLVVLDFDAPEAYETWIQWISRTRAASLATSTYKVFSARGVHAYLKVAEPVTSYHIGQIDVKARWGYVLAPPSIHPSGVEYRGVLGAIAECETLSDVFPLRPAPRAFGSSPCTVTDPYESASKAIVPKPGAISRIHESVRIEDLLGIAPTRAQIRVRCPLHDDHNPSMLVNTEKQYCVCFAGCNDGHRMDVIDLYAALHGISNREAIAEMDPD